MGDLWVLLKATRFIEGEWFGQGGPSAELPCSVSVFHVRLSPLSLSVSFHAASAAATFSRVSVSLSLFTADAPAKGILACPGKTPPPRCQGS